MCNHLNLKILIHIFYNYLSHYDYNCNGRWKFRGTRRWPRRHTSLPRDTGCASLSWIYVGLSALLLNTIKIHTATYMNVDWHTWGKFNWTGFKRSQNVFQVLGTRSKLLSARDVFQQLEHHLACNFVSFPYLGRNTHTHTNSIHVPFDSVFNSV
jgi:hypothetical protein